MTLAAFCSGTNGPWITVSSKEVVKQDLPEDILLLRMDASVMGSLEEMYQMFSQVFQLPDYFGKNFNALDECLTDLEWLSANGYLVVIKNAEHLLYNDTDDVLEGILLILNDAGEEWATPVAQGDTWDREGIPFHTILEFDKAKAPAFFQKLKKFSFEFNEF